MGADTTPRANWHMTRPYLCEVIAYCIGLVVGATLGVVLL